MARNVTYSVAPRINPRDKEAAPKYYGRVQANGDVNIREMSERIQQTCTVHKADVQAVLLALEDASFGDDERERVGKFIQMNLKLDDYRSSTGRKGRFVLSRGGTTIGLGKIITGYDPDKRKFTLKTEGQYFSSDFKKRL